MRPLRHFALAAFVILMPLTSPARPRAAADDVLPFKATEHSLANGLKVIVVPTGFPNLVSIDIPVQVGSRNEVEKGRSGFAHFFEHLMFRGTPATPPEKYRDIMSRAGARDNASTGDDRTHFYSTFAKEHLDEVIALYADMFQHLAYSESDFKTEARAVLGEYNKNSADPAEKLFEVQREHYYQAHTYKHTTMGFIADIEDMPNEYRVLEAIFRAVVPPAVHDGGDRRRRDAGGCPSADRKVLGRLAEQHDAARADPEGAGAQGAAIRARALDQQHAALRIRCVSRSAV